MSFKRYAPRPYSKIQPFRVVTTPGDFGGPGTTTYYNDGPPVECKVRELSDEAKVAAAKTVTKTLYRCWADMPQPFILEQKSVKLPAKSGSISGGTHNIIGVIEYPERGIVQFELERIN